MWWWGEAHDFGGDPVTVAFAGGPALGPLRATAVVVHVDGRLVRRGEPVLAGVHAEISPGRWALRGRGVEIEAEADPADAHVLDVPVPRERRTLPWSDQHLAGRLRVKLTRRGRAGLRGRERARRTRTREGTVTGWIKRQRERRGTMPDDVRAELEAEGIEILEERIAAQRPLPPLRSSPGSDRRAASRTTILALGLTPKRLALRGTGNFLARRQARPGELRGRPSRGS